MSKLDIVVADGVIIGQTIKNEKSRGGIYLPESARDKEKVKESKVLACCEFFREQGVEFESEVQVGDNVFHFGGYEAVLGGREVTIIRYHELIGWRRREENDEPSVCDNPVCLCHDEDNS